MSNDTIIIGRFQSQPFGALLQDETVPCAVHYGTAWLLCCLIVGIQTSGIFFSMSQLMLLGWVIMWIAFYLKNLKLNRARKWIIVVCKYRCIYITGWPFEAYYLKFNKCLAEIYVSRVSSVNRPFYSCGLGARAFDRTWGWGCPCFDTNLILL